MPRYQASGVRPGQPAREHLCLFPDRRDQAIDDARVLGALADRIDVGARAAVYPARQIVSDDDAALDIETGTNRQVDVCPDACSDHDEIALDQRAVAKPHAGHLRIAENGRGGGVQVQLHPHLAQISPQHHARCGVELGIHHVRHQVENVDLEAAVEQAPCSLEPEQPAADHHRRA